MSRIVDRQGAIVEARDAGEAGVERQVRPVRYDNKGLLLLRVVVGALFVGHGVQKLFGWFGGDGMAAFTQSLAKLGIQPAPFWAYFEAGTELVGGLLLILGLLTPLAAAALIGDMLVATFKVHAGKGLWAQQGGFEYNLVLIALLVAVGLIGPGMNSLDRHVGLRLPRPATFLAAALAVGAVVALVVL
jgi:putative oxidoreductase